MSHFSGPRCACHPDVNITSIRYAEILGPMVLVSVTDGRPGRERWVPRSPPGHGGRVFPAREGMGCWHQGGAALVTPSAGLPVYGEAGAGLGQARLSDQLSDDRPRIPAHTSGRWRTLRFGCSGRSVRWMLRRATTVPKPSVRQPRPRSRARASASPASKPASPTSRYGTRRSAH